MDKRANIKRLCLGTVKLGIPDYGFSSNLKIDSETKKIDFLIKAFELGIRKFDTSPRYGESEKILGSFFNQILSKEIEVYTKIDNLKPDDKKSQYKIFKSIEKSLKTLNQDFIEICYLHQNEIEIISDKNIIESMQLLKEQKLIKNFGVSLYYRKEFEYAVNEEYIDYIQLPVNIFDSNFYFSFENCRKKLIARSIFLQGLLFNNNDLNKLNYGKQIFDYLTLLNKISNEYKISLEDLSIGFISSLLNIDFFIIGTTNIDNLIKNIRALSYNFSDELFQQIKNLSKEPKIWSNPRNWIFN